MGKQNIHVVPHDGEWAKRRAGSSRVSSVYKTQQAAINDAVSSAKKDGVEVVIHRADGRIRDKDSYGNDPHPPVDKKH